MQFQRIIQNRQKPCIMAIVNLTPDSFSGDGILHSDAPILRHITHLLQSGADLIDLGAESTRPGAQIIDAQTEQARLLPQLKSIRQEFPQLLISVDTYKPSTAKKSLDLGANIINDINGFGDPEMVQACISAEQIIVMHNNAKFRKTFINSYQTDDKNHASVPNILDFFVDKIKFLQENSYQKSQIIIDPGLGFGKTIPDSMEIIANLAQFAQLGCASLIGVSRKSFLGKICGRNINERMAASLSVCANAFHAGTEIIRVHDVKESFDFLNATQAIASRYNNICYIALGSNLGDKHANLAKCHEYLQKLGNITQFSSIHSTENPYLVNQPLFANQVIALQTNIEPPVLLNELKKIESMMGRDFNEVRNGPRIIDCDIIAFGDLIYADENLQIPHKMAQMRDFVLKPMAEIAPYYRFRDSGFNVLELLNKINN